VTEKDWKAQELAAELRREEARIDAQRASAAADDASREMSEISERADLRDSLGRAHDRFVAWDDARGRRFNARLDEAGAKLREWKANYKVEQAREGMREHDALARLEEQTALARARLAAWNVSHHERAAEEALEDAARNFAAAFEAAASRYDK
jgi:hypothetical protein